MQLEPTAIAARRALVPARDARRMVACKICHIQFDCSPRAYRNYKAGRREPRCLLHRREQARPETQIALDRRMWLDQYTLAEIFVMGRAIEMTLTGRRIECAPRLRADVVRIEDEYLALAASADAR